MIKFPLERSFLTVMQRLLGRALKQTVMEMSIHQTHGHTLAVSLTLKSLSA